VKNLFDLPQPLPQSELFETLCTFGGAKLERIISQGQITPPGEWYDQAQDEWVLLVQGQAHLRFENGKIQELQTGDWLLIPAHHRHRVEYTSSQPVCIWLALHFSAN